MNKPWLVTYLTFWEEGHMRVTSFLRTQGGCGSWPAPPADAILQRQGGKKNLPLVAKGACHHRQFAGVWVGILGGDLWQELVREAIPSSGYSDHCPSNALLKGPRAERRPYGGGGGGELSFLFLLAPHWHRKCQLPILKFSPSAQALGEGLRGSERAWLAFALF